jgi:hypothetical protein
MAERAWHDAMFGGADGDRLAIEMRRRAAAAGWFASRAAFVPVALGHSVSPFRWAIPTPDDVERIHGERRRDPDRAYMPPDLAAPIAISPWITEAMTRTAWLRFSSPSLRLGDVATARITEPTRGAIRGTVVVCNGLCIEPELYPRDIASLDKPFLARGIRVINLCSPFHGRRTPHDAFGGEMFVANAPLGTLDLFLGAAAELQLLIAWAARNFGRPIGLAGLSMGALVTQLVISRGAHDGDARPDGAVLITHGDDLLAITFAGGLSTGLGLDRKLRAKGWNEATFEPWRALFEPSDELRIDPVGVVSVRARHDLVMPFTPTLPTLDAWRIAPSNRFVLRASHFSLPAIMSTDPAPLDRFVAALVDSDSTAPRLQA